MYIQPSSELYICSGVKLEPSYEHTVFFSNAQQQFQAFQRYVKYEYSYGTGHRMTYLRHSVNQIRVQTPCESLYDCNYIIFGNNRFTNKWFYAFITNVEYVNENCSQITYQIDIMQTWFFDYTLDTCFVERQHTSTDNLFEHLVEEDVNIGDEYIAQNIVKFDLAPLATVMVVSRLMTGTLPDAYLVNGYVPQKLGYYFWLDLTEQSQRLDFNDTVNWYVNNGLENAILMIYQYPSNLINRNPLSARGYAPTGLQTEATLPGPPALFDGYMPRNRKLYNYPYSFIRASNYCGQTLELKWENWLYGHTGEISVSGTPTTTPSVVMIPKSYKENSQMSNRHYYDADINLIYTNFPQTTWVGENFAVWWAQNKAAVATTGLTGALTASLGALTGQAGIAYGGASSMLNNITNVIGTYEKLNAMPNSVYGQMQSESLNPFMEHLGFCFYYLTIRENQAMIIDDYFDRFGYKINRNMIPVRDVRKHWTYVKTAECAIHGSMPASDLEAIKRIYNNGITFWKNITEVGDYSLANDNTAYAT